MNILTDWKKYGFYSALTLLTALFLMAGVTKVSGAEMHIETFTRYGLPVAFMYFIGAAEIAGAIGIWFTKISALTASGLISIMLGAITMHIIHDPISTAIPAVVAALLLLYVIKLRVRDTLFQSTTPGTATH